MTAVPASEPGRAVGEAAALLRLGYRAALAYGRGDLAARLDDLRDRLDRDRVDVVVLGEFKSGKSSLVNAIIGADVCPVDVDVATAVPTVVEHAEQPLIEVMSRGDDGAVVSSPIDPTTAGSWIRGEHAGATSVRVGLPRRLLADGIVLVDTPGVGGLDARQVVSSLGVLTTADLVLFVTDGANELGGPTLELLALVHGLVPTLDLVLTKADQSLHVDDVAEADREHLSTAGLDVVVHVTSAQLRSVALRRRDAALDAESGVPTLVRRLREVAALRGDQAARAAALAVADVSEQLRQVFVAERSAIVAVAADRASGRGAAVSSSAPAGGGAPGAAGPSSWQQLLSDEIADFSSDLEFVLRRRARDLVAEAEAALADGDPDEVWTELSGWLEERAASDVVATFSTLRERTSLIAARVAERFDLGEGGAATDTAVLDELVRHVLASLPERAALGASTASKSTSGLNAFRSTFYAFTMFSTVGALVGIAAAPAALVLGLVIGGKSVRDDRVRGRQQRRGQAKQAVRAYLDEVAFVAGKESRDALRLVQRALRDHFTAVAAERQRTMADAAAAAKRAAETDELTRRARLADVDAELARIEVVAQRAQALIASLDASVLSPMQEVAS